MATRINWHPEKFLNKLDIDLANRVDEAGNVVEEKAKESCPVATGALRDSIKAVVGENRLKVKIGSSLPYATYVEYGTRNTPAQPFLRKGRAKSVTFIRRIFKGKR